MGLDHDITASGQVANEHPARVAHAGGIDVLVAASEFLHGVDVLAAFMGKSSRAYPRQARIVPDIGNLIDELRQLLQFA